MSDVLKHLSEFSPLIVLVLGWKQRFSLLWIYAAIGLLVEILTLIVISKKNEPHAIGGLFLLCQLFLISAFYYYNLFDRSRYFMIFFMVLATGFIIHTAVSPKDELNFLGAGILCAVYIVYGIMGYLKLVGNLEVNSLTRLPFFWINTSIFLYASSNCLLFLFGTYLKEESFKLMLSIWFSYFVAINILHYILIAIGLYKTPLRET